jgi:hypothetical protein
MTDKITCPAYFRLAPNNGLNSDITRCLRGATSGSRQLGGFEVRLRFGTLTRGTSGGYRQA